MKPPALKPGPSRCSAAFWPSGRQNAALHRGDDAEAQRLACSAPRIQLSLPDYHGLNEGLVLLTFFHVIGQLERGLLYWQLSGTAADWEEFTVGPEDQERIERLWKIACLLAYRLGAVL
jgi:hypothetical protein